MYVYIHTFIYIYIYILYIYIYTYIYTYIHTHTYSFQLQIPASPQTVGRGVISCWFRLPGLGKKALQCLGCRDTCFYLPLPGRKPASLQLGRQLPKNKDTIVCQSSTKQIVIHHQGSEGPVCWYVCCFGNQSQLLLSSVPTTMSHYFAVALEWGAS